MFYGWSVGRGIGSTVPSPRIFNNGVFYCKKKTTRRFGISQIDISINASDLYEQFCVFQDYWHINAHHIVYWGITRNSLFRIKFFFRITVRWTKIEKFYSEIFVHFKDRLDYSAIFQVSVQLFVNISTLDFILDKTCIFFFNVIA